MTKKNIVFIATSIDGYIADKNGGLEWLETVPNPNQEDMGYVEFSNSIDALLMGRNTYEKVMSFGIDWPYRKPVFVLSNTLKEIPQELENKVFLINGEIKSVLETIHQKGFYKLYIDGGKTIQSLLKEGLIDEMILTTIPILLGGGARLFDTMPSSQSFQLVSSKTYLNQIVQTHYKKKV